MDALHGSITPLPGLKILVDLIEYIALKGVEMLKEEEFVQKIGPS